MSKLPLERKLSKKLRLLAQYAMHLTKDAESLTLIGESAGKSTRIVVDANNLVWCKENIKCDTIVFDERIDNGEAIQGEPFFPNRKTTKK